MMHQSCLAMYELFKFKQKKVTIKSRCVKCMINNSKYLSKSDVWCWPMRAELALSDWTPTKHGHISIVRASIIWRPNDFINLIISIFVIKSDQWFTLVMRCARPLWHWHNPVTTFYWRHSGSCRLFQLHLANSHSRSYASLIKHNIRCDLINSQFGIEGSLQVPYRPYKQVNLCLFTISLCLMQR